MLHKIPVRFLTAACLSGALWVLPAAPQSDNTKANQGQQTTADQATNTKTDRDLMKKIRQSIMSDKSLSTDAHNVKVIAQNGKVTLKGPVSSGDEKNAVEAKAVEVAGAGNVTDELTVKGTNPNGPQQ